MSAAGAAISKAPILADRRGLRWLLGGRVLPGGAIVFLTHRGRRTGRTYRTPVEAIVEDHDAGRIIVCPSHGERAGWYRNIVAGGLVEVRVRGRSVPVDWRQLSPDECLEALGRYRREHPLWARLILRSLARTNGLSGEALPAVARSVPLIAMTPRNPAQPAHPPNEARGQ